VVSERHDSARQKRAEYAEDMKAIVAQKTAYIEGRASQRFDMARSLSPQRIREVKEDLVKRNQETTASLRQAMADSELRVMRFRQRELARKQKIHDAVIDSRFDLS